jgi:tetratricopeptide (TPR) repeat protein
MSSTLLTVVLLASFPSQGAAQAPDKARFRELACLPRVGTKMDFGGFYFNGPELHFGMRPQPKDQLAEAEKALKEAPNDPRRYLALASQCATIKDEKRVDELVRTALKLAQEQLKANPDDGYAITLYAQALAANEMRAEAVKLLRRAVTVAPERWECWMELGNFLQDEAFQFLPERKVRSGGFEDRLMMTVALVQKNNPPPAQLSTAAKILDEAEQCYEKAMRCRPRDARAYRERLASRFAVGFLRSIIAAMRGDKAENVMKLVFSPQCLADLDQAAEVSPNDHKAHLAVIGFEMMACLGDKKLSFGDLKLKLMDHLSPEGRRRVETAIKQLEKLAAGPDRATAAGSCEGLGQAYLFGTGQHEQAVARLRRALELDPGRDSARDLLEFYFVIHDRNEDLLALSLERIKREDTARHRYVAAKAYDLLKQTAKAEEQVRAALRLDPKDFHANLGFAALLLRRAQKEDDLKAAAEYLERADLALTPKSDPCERTDWAVNQAVYLGLTGRVEAARQYAREAAERDPQYGNIKKLRAALGE